MIATGQIHRDFVRFIRIRDLVVVVTTVLIIKIYNGYSDCQINYASIKYCVPPSDISAQWLYWFKKIYL